MFKYFFACLHIHVTGGKLLITFSLAAQCVDMRMLMLYNLIFYICFSILFQSCADWRITNKLYANPYRLSFSYVEGAGYVIEDSDLVEFKTIFRQCTEYIDYFFENLNKYIEYCTCVHDPRPSIYTTATLTPYEYDETAGEHFEVSEASKKLFNSITSKEVCPTCLGIFKILQ